jgi:hypothetical protein
VVVLGNNSVIHLGYAGCLTFCVVSLDILLAVRKIGSKHI